MKKLLSYLITLIIGLIGGICCHDIAIDWLDEYIKKHRFERRRHNLPYINTNYSAYPWVYKSKPSDCYKDIYYETRADANKILIKMQKESNENIVTIADLKAFSGFISDFNDTRYGWTDLGKAKIYRARDGKYYLDLPEPFLIDDLEG